LARSPDLRGHGAERPPDQADDYSLDLLEADLLALVDELGWDRFVLLGHSMGGMASQAIAIHHPERLDGLVLMDTIPGTVGGEGSPCSCSGRGPVFGMKAMARFVEAAAPVARVGAAPLRRAARLRRRDAAQGARHVAGDGPGDDVRAARPGDQLPALRSLDLPCW
jgi:pimeloyl-ACP methyl ester carboxylesterase